jgi:ABC-type transporter MlaC component
MTVRPAGLLRVILVVPLLGGSPVIAGAPADRVRATVDRVLSIVENSQLNPAESRAQAQKALYARFDFAEMAKRSLGLEWRRRRKIRCDRFHDRLIVRGRCLRGDLS